MRTLWSPLCAAWGRLRSGRQRGQRWAGVELSGNRLHVVVLTAPAADGRVRVLECSTRELDGELSLPVLSALAASLHSRPEHWSLLLSRDDYRVSVIPAPDVPDTELAQSVRWQLAPTLDFSAEEASIDLMRIPTAPWDTGRAPELYAIAARSEKVTASASLWREAGLPLSAIDIHETAQRNIAVLGERAGELLVMVAFGEQEVRITCSWHGELYMDRLIAEQTRVHDTPARRAMLCDRIALQVQRSLDAVRGSYGFMQTARIVAAGAPEGFCDTLAALIADPVETLTPDTWFDLSATPELGDPETFMRYFAAVGTALRGVHREVVSP